MESQTSADDRDAEIFHIGQNMDEEKELIDTMSSGNFDTIGEKDIYCFSFNVWQKDRYRNFTYFSYDKNKLKKAYMYRLDNTPSQIRQYPEHPLAETVGMEKGFVRYYSSNIKADDEACSYYRSLKDAFEKAIAEINADIKS